MNHAERMQRLQELFNASLERPRPDRAAFLQAACADDTELQHEVETLLAAHDEADGFLTAPALPPEAATQIQAPPLLPRIISHYEVIAPLGKGGMGEVYLASDKTLGRKVALKILPERYTTNADLVHRFEREAKAASALNHPNILTVYEIGQTEDSHFIATEFIAGETLRQRIGRGNLSLTEALDIAGQVAAALNAAHEAGIIHRDIKPENIMLRPDGYVKVLDFGLAKLTESAVNPEESTTQTGLIMGTPSYMSPEQARGQKVDARTDLWSLGVVLFELVSGARPFGGDTQADLLVAILERAPLPLPDSLPPELVRTINRALAKDPSQRYATAREFGQDLKALQHKLERVTERQHLVEESTLNQIADAPTLQMAPVLRTEPSEEQPPALATVVAAQPPVRWAARTKLFGLIVVAGLGIGSWYWFKPAPPHPANTLTTTQPPRELTWWLTIQRRLAGKLEGRPFQSHGRDFLPNGSTFKFNLTSPQAGYLYLLNEGPTTGGKTSLNLLYPTPANNNRNAAVAANQPLQTDNYVVDIHEGEEKFWIVWAANPVAEIEVVKATATPAINPPTDTIYSFLNKYVSQSEAKSDEATERTKVSGGEVIVSFVKLKHR